MNPLSRLIAAIVAVLLLTGAFFFGLAVLAVLVVVFSIFGLVIYLRSWWRSRGAGSARTIRSRTESDGTVIDAEYTVISRRRK